MSKIIHIKKPFGNSQGIIKRVLISLLILCFVSLSNLPSISSIQKRRSKKKVFKVDFPFIQSLSFSKMDTTLRNWKKNAVKTNALSHQYPYKPLPECKLALYRIKKGDTLWKIISRTSLDIDTMAQVNRLSSIHDIRPNDIMVIPNMRGRLMEVKKNLKLNDITKKFKIPIVHLVSANKNYIKIGHKRFLFLPNAKFSRIERDLFFGAAFHPPLKKARLSSKFGARRDPFTDRRTFHGGIDLAANKGTRVFAAREGKVVFAGWKKAYGKLVVIKHDLGYSTVYGHLSKISVKPGARVKRAMEIGKVGSTGKSTGPHLHFEIKRLGRSFNPKNYLRKWQHDG